MRLPRFASERGRHGICRATAVLLFASLSSFALTPDATAQNAPTAHSPGVQDFATFIAEASQRFHIPEDWIRAVKGAESEHVNDVSSAGAMGLMQIMPETWAELRARLHLGSDAFDPHDNILAGTAYLREMLDRYGDVSAMLAAYNAGPSRYDDYLATGRLLPAETRNYVAKLAPLLSGESLPGTATAASSRPADWREAPLFAVVAGGGPSAGPLRHDGQSTASVASTSTSHSDAASTPRDSIFVSISRRDSTP